MLKILIIKNRFHMNHFIIKDQIIELKKVLNNKINKRVEIKPSSKNRKIKVTIEFADLDDVESFFTN